MAETEEKEVNTLMDIQELFILVARGEDGVEGVASYVDPRDGVMKPGLGRRERMPELLAIGQALANESGIPICLTRWSIEPDYERLTPACWRQGG